MRRGLERDKGELNVADKNKELLYMLLTYLSLLVLSTYWDAGKIFFFVVIASRSHPLFSALMLLGFHSNPNASKLAIWSSVKVFSGLLRACLMLPQK